MPKILLIDVAALTPYQEELQALGYTNTDQFAGAAAAAGPALAKYLRISTAELSTLIHSLPVTSQRPMVPRPTPLRLGALLDRIPRKRAAFALARIGPAALPASVNLIAEMQPIRDQQQRGTCVAHASTAVAEHYWRAQGKMVDMSRQFLYWDCKQHDGVPNEEGTWISVAMPLLQSDGCCLEATWPYVGYDIPGNEGQGPAPGPASVEASTYRIPGYRDLAPTSIADIKGELAADHCVAFTIPVFDSWYHNNEVSLTGDIVNPIPGEVADGGHAMCFVGYEDQPTHLELGGGVFYIRNSWDSQWATQPTLGVVGYGTIPYSYIAKFGAEAFSID